MAYIDKINKDGTDHDVQDSKAARSVDGDTSSHVAEANQIFTETGFSQTDYFIFRTTAGAASVANGSATLIGIIGNTEQTGHTDEILDVNGIFADEETTVSIDKPTWRSYVQNDGEYTFSYDGSSWNLNDSPVTLSSYGLTISGNITEGDQIVVGYTALVIGTLATAKPTSFVATGFNQYNATAGYAHVLGDTEYRIDGTYTSLGFTTEIGGTTTAVTVTDGRFTPTEDGYIYVTGASGDILIALVWSGTRNNDPYEAYSESTITIPTVDANNTSLPTATYGMPSVKNVHDTLNFEDKLYVQRIGHYTYSAENLATVEALGVDYVYDLSDIFYILATPVTYSLASTVSGEYTANDYGTEEFMGTSVKVGGGFYYGNNLADKLRRLADIQSIGSGLSLSADGELSSAGGGGDTVYSSVRPTNAVYIPHRVSSNGTYTPTPATELSTGSESVSILGSQYQTIAQPDNSVNILGRFYKQTYNPNNSVLIGSMAEAYSWKDVIIGHNASDNNGGDNNEYGVNVAIGYSAKVVNGSSSSVAIGGETWVSQANKSVALGYGAKCAGYNRYSVALGAYSVVPSGTSSDYTKGVVSVGGENSSYSSGSTYGYNNTYYRKIINVYDGEDAHDVATKGQLDKAIINGGTTAPTTSTVGEVGTLYSYVDTSGTPTAHLYACTVVDTTDPNAPVYTWSQLV